jgi:formylglycine-generating enzyme required for sulfatase activity
MPRPTCIFISYAREDTDSKDKLLLALAGLKQQGRIEIRQDFDLPAGGDWEANIRAWINEAHVILLLVSPEFVASKFSQTVEVPEALRRKTEGARVIPISIREIVWEHPEIRKLNWLPIPRVPIADGKRSKNWTNVAKEIAKVLPTLEQDEQAPYEPSELEKLYQIRNERRKTGNPTFEIDAQIQNQKRQLRDGKLLANGDVLAERFTLVQHIASGGFGSVWKAWDSKFKKHVALKFLRPDRINDSAYRSRFFRGAAQMAALEHRCIARIIEPKLSEGSYYFFAMQFVEGRNLFDAIKEGRLDREQIPTIICDIADALEYAYETQRLIHRDVKPDNILVDLSNRGLLIDFDLVHAPDATPMSTFQGMGNKDFAAPEVYVDGRSARHQSDIYSLAKTTLWALCGGKAIPNDPLKFRSAIEALILAPRQTFAIVKALDVDPSRRHVSVRQFADALTRRTAPRRKEDEWSEVAEALSPDQVDEHLIEELIHEGPSAVAALVKTIDNDFEGASLKKDILNIRTLRQRRGIYILAKMRNREAVDYLRSLTPPGLLLIPAGQFLMGSNEFENERPIGEVWVDSFWIAEYPVSNAEFFPFIAEGYRSNKYWTLNGWDSLQSVRRLLPFRWSDSLLETHADHPVQWLSWYEANAFVNWLVKSKGSHYRLPTEAQWEKAASWDEQTARKRKYPWGETYDTRMHPIGNTAPKNTFPDAKSPCGAQHMCGFVWQWTSSLRWTYPYSAEDGREDPERKGERVMRGGCWANQQEIDYYRCTSRYHPSEPVPPDYNLFENRNGPCGVRVCVSIHKSDLRVQP